jgi:hypothetical protein
MKLRSILVLAAALSVTSNSFAQAFRIQNTTWTFGLGDHIVVDGGKEMSFPFQTKAWNYLPYPTKVYAEMYFVKGWSFQTELAYTQYKSGNIMDNVTISKPGTYFGFDGNAKFAMNHWANKQGWFDPYFTFGYGYTYRSLARNTSTANNNLGLGCNFWIYKGFGLNLQGLGKFAMKGGTKSNYTHYSVSLVYKLQSKGDKMGIK